MDLSTIPAAAPPPGVTPNPENPPSLLPTMVIALACIQTVTLPFIVLRLCVNIRMRRCHLEDAFLYVAWCAFVAQTGLTIYTGTTGIARHMWDMNLATLSRGSYNYSNVVICYTISGGFAKAAVFLQLKKIFTTPLRGTVYWVIVVSLVVNAIAYTILLFIYIFDCWPRKKVLDPTIPGHCLDWKKSIIAIGTFNLVSDIEALCVPAFAIWRLRLDIKKKLEVFAVFAAGALAVGIACFGLYSRVILTQKYDTTWYLAQSAIVYVAELASVIIVGCCPAIPRLFRRNRNKYYAHTHQRCSNACCHSGSSRGKSRKQTLEDSNASAGQESNSVVTLQMYGYTNSIDHGSEDISFSGQDIHTISRPGTSIQMTV